MSYYQKRTVQSLSKLCLKKLENNPKLIIKPLHNNIPYFILESVVRRCSPEQLLKLEKLNKSYRSETQELWKVHCKENFTDIRNEIEEGKLDGVEDWRDLYWKRQQSEDARLQRIKEKMQLSYSKLKKTKEKKSIKLSDSLRPHRARSLYPSSSSNSTTYTSSNGTLKIRKGATLIQRARAIAKKSKSNFDFPPIQNHSVSSSSSSRSPVSRSSVSTSNVSSSGRHGKSLSNLKSRMSSRSTSSSDIMVKRRPTSSSLPDSKRPKTEKISSSSWDASSSFFSKF
ncbi:hypothetical protein LY90DRAFT_673918 [Neocallimastix californiae]|jgi:hypothetical protein|uniref:Elongin-A n=1 Tax=Neocallimastix californiae TaxID=1754190 RepID=A0A1Y2B530_9FUNG|nr:hypothetical protein LY90DRAFT_673918 [Neocallimastix californiae]|eukprot:ORY29587.1 hypothetical protein LY90DRAFT_673918 [Neocallimastix californiae]